LLEINRTILQKKDMNSQVNIQNITINDFQQLRDFGQFSLTNSEFCCVLIINESMGLNEQLSKVIETYFEDQQKALVDFLKIRDHIFAALADLDLNTKDIIDDLSDVFVDAVWLLEDEPQDSFEYVKSQVVPLGEIAISKIFFFALLKTPRFLSVNNKLPCMTGCQRNLRVSRQARTPICLTQGKMAGLTTH
jgi:hypothetical protein